MLCATVAALTWTITMLLCSLHDTHTCPAGTTLVMMPTAAKQTEDVARDFMDVRVFQERYDRGHNLTILNSDVGWSCYIDKKPESSHFEMAARNGRNQLMRNLH